MPFTSALFILQYSPQIWNSYWVLSTFNALRSTCVPITIQSSELRWLLSFFPVACPQTVFRSAEFTLYRSWLRAHCPGFCLAFYFHSVFYFSSNLERANSFLAASALSRGRAFSSYSEVKLCTPNSYAVKPHSLDSSLNANLADFIFSYALFLPSTNYVLIHHSSPDTLHVILLYVCTPMSNAFWASWPILV